MITQIRSQRSDAGCVEREHPHTGWGRRSWYYNEDVLQGRRNHHITRDDECVRQQQAASLPTAGRKTVIALYSMTPPCPCKGRTLRVAVTGKAPELHRWMVVRRADPVFMAVPGPRAAVLVLLGDMLRAEHI